MRPDSARIRVGLPAPFEPISAVISPRRTAMSMPHSTWISPSPAHSPCSSRIRESATAGIPLCVLLPEIGIDHGGILHHVTRLSVGDQLSVVEHGDTGADVEHNLHQMLDHHDGDPALRELIN